MSSLVRSQSLSAAAVGLALSLFSIGCGDDSDDGGSSGLDGGTGLLDSGTANGDAGAGSDGGDGGTSAPSEAPVYAFATITGAPPSVTTYVTLTDKLTGEVRTQGAALEVAGNATVTGPLGGKRLFVGTQASPLLTRYELKSDGTLAKNGELSFMPRGVAGFSAYGSNFQFISANKAYFFANNAAKIVVWDPEALTLTGELAVPQVARPDPESPGTNYTSSVTGAPIHLGDKIYWFVAWDSRPTAGSTKPIKIPPASAVVVLDTKADTAKVVVDEATCGYTRDGVVSGDYIYVASENAASSVHQLNNANAAPPCMRRFNYKTEQFDPAFKADLVSIAGAVAGSLFVAPNGTPYLFVLDKSLVDPSKTNPREFASGIWWKQARLTVGDNPTVELLNLPPSSGSALPQVLKSLTITPGFGAAPQLREVTNDGIMPTSRVDAKLFGTVQSYVQLR